MEESIKEKFWQEKPEPVRILLPHDNGGMLNVFSDRYIIWEATQVRPAGNNEKMYIFEKKNEAGN